MIMKGEAVQDILDQRPAKNSGQVKKTDAR
jgi:hypothetical protein